VVTYTGNGTTATVGHGLGVTPGLIIIKTRNITRDWLIWTTGYSVAEYLLFTTAAKQTFSLQWGQLPTSSVFGVLNDTVNQNGNTFVAYCFAPVTGYSSFGSYTGNGSADGSFVYLGFRPAFLMIKRTNSTGNWVMLDNKREEYNVDNDPLYANLTNVEGTDDLVDITSNGFKLRSTATDVNASGSTYVYAVFAENPFQYARAR
jgi:hypothetical protein